jgi:glycosyltransferase involved in cell wall biosynthesis
MPHMYQTPIDDQKIASKRNLKPSNVAGRRRILYVHNSADIYGASRSLTRLLGGLDRRQFEPSVLLPEEGPLKGFIENLDVKVFVDSSLAILTRYTARVPLFLYRFPISVWRLHWLMRKERIDLVHTNTGVIFSPGLASRLAGVRHLWHVRESFDEFRGQRWKIYSAYMRMVSNKIVCVSNAVAEQFTNRKKVVVIHNGFPLDEFAVDQPSLRREFRQRFKIRETDFVVACVGRIKWKRKGQEFLVQAAALLRDKGKPVTLVIVGAPWPGNEEHLHRLRSFVEESDLQDRVVFTGELPDARPAYAASDVVALPSAQPEPFAGVVMEAMSMGKPVIATTIGGSLDQVVDGQTGYLVPPAEPDALAEKILILMEDPELRRRMGEAGMERIRTNFDFQRMVERLETIYREVLAR